MNRKMRSVRSREGENKGSFNLHLLRVTIGFGKEDMEDGGKNGKRETIVGEWIHE